MAILSKNASPEDFACSSEDSGIDGTYEYENSEKSISPKDRLRVVKQEIGTALFHNRNLRLEVNQLALTLGSLLRDLTQQENTLQTALRFVDKAIKKTEGRSEDE